MATGLNKNQSTKPNSPLQGLITANKKGIISSADFALLQKLALNASQTQTITSKLATVTKQLSTYTGSKGTLKTDAEDVSVAKKRLILDEITLAQQPENPDLLNDYNADNKTYTTAVAKQSTDNTAYKGYVSQSKILNQNLTDLQKNPNKTLPNPLTSNAPSGQSATTPTDFVTYTYNIPMVDSAYITNKFTLPATKTQPAVGNPQVLSAGTGAFITDPGAKGAIQMSQYFVTSFNKQYPLSSSTKSTEYKLDSTPYGFKFLYNPTSISMNWGLVEAFSPQYEQQGNDPASPIGTGLMQSTISFSLMLNRIGDMAVIDKNGLKSGVKAPYKTYSKKWDAELKTIYLRGTMYDLEYFFKATGGFNATYTSTLNGDTADKGWLQPIPVELHLGDGLRYLVRISSLDVNHIMFNERMVPVLTQVDLTCARYFDGLDSQIPPVTSTPPPPSKTPKGKS